MQQFEQQVLNVFADIAGFGQRGGIADGERHVEHSSQSPRQQRFTRTGGADQQDVGFVDLDAGTFPTQR